MTDEKLFRLWPTFVLRKQFPDHDKIKPGLLDFIGSYMEEDPEGRKANENRNLYESKYDILRRFAEKNASLKALGIFLAQSFAEISTAANHSVWQRDGIKPEDLSVQITASWFINYRDRGNVHPHLHGNCSWSCVYYLQMGATADSMDGATYFICPSNKSDSSDIGAVYASEASRYFSAKEGYALFFPSHLVHGSFPYEGDAPRIIFSANARLEKQKGGT
jgi:uncharacterized protein (TIGR02466 family)